MKRERERERFLKRIYHVSTTPDCPIGARWIAGMIAAVRAFISGIVYHSKRLVAPKNGITIMKEKVDTDKSLEASLASA